MEYLVIIAFVGLIIFKAIKKSSEVSNEETAKTMLPGKQSVAPRNNKKPLQPADSWEEWFTDDVAKQEVPAAQKTASPRQPMEQHLSTSSKEQKTVLAEPSVCCDPPIKLNSREEVRRAIIYSEILNRKY